MAIKSNFRIKKIYFREEIPLDLDFFINKETEIFFFKKKLFDLLSGTEKTSKVIAIADKKNYSLDDIF